MAAAKSVEFYQRALGAEVEMLHDKNLEKAQRDMAAMMQMNKIDIAALKGAYDRP